MRLRILKFGLVLLGAAAIAIGSSIFCFGASPTANFFAGILSFIDSNIEPIADLGTANIDNELRFYAVFWVAYGAILINMARKEDFSRLPLLIGLFFLGGVGRLLSTIMVGAPHILFSVLMVIEFILPAILIGLWISIRRN